jgi:Na+/proline symporter
MSNIDSGLNRNSAILVRDIVPLFRRLLGKPDLSDTAGLWLGRIFSLFLGAAIIYLALLFADSDGGTGIFEHMLTVGAVTAVPMSVPMFLALFIRKVPRWSAIVSIAAAAIPSAIGFSQGWAFQVQVFSNFAAGSAAFFATMAFWGTASDRYKQRVAEFFRRMHTPIDFAKEVGRPNDPAQLKIVGGFALAAAGFIATLLLLPNDAAGRLSILAIAAFVGGAGALMFITGLRGQRRLDDELDDEMDASLDHDL